MNSSLISTERLICSRRYPVRYLFIPKCGCTFVKNLIWRMDNGSHYENGPRIHDKEADFARASDLGLTVENIRAEDYCFVVLRNPVDRFLSLYLDKVVGGGHLRFVPLREKLVLRGLNIEAKSSADHRENCTIMIDWIRSNLSGATDLPTDPHWTPQAYRMDIISDCNLKLLLLGDLNSQISSLLSEIVPNLGPLLRTTERYATNSKTTKFDILDSELRKAINSVYRADRDMFEKVREAWAKVKQTSPKNVPRAWEVFGR